MKTRIYQKKYVISSVNSEGHPKKIGKNQEQHLFRPRRIHLCYQKSYLASWESPFKDFWDGIVQSKWLAGVFQSPENQFKTIPEILKPP
jgi:hypothetical protein